MGMAKACENNDCTPVELGEMGMANACENNDYTPTEHAAMMRAKGREKRRNTLKQKSGSTFDVLLKSMICGHTITTGNMMSVGRQHWCFECKVTKGGFVTMEEWNAWDTLPWYSCDTCKGVRRDTWRKEKE